MASPLRHSTKFLLNLLLREQSLLPILDVFSVGWVGIRPSQGATAALRLAKITQDPACSNWTRGAHCEQDYRYWAASLQEQDIHHCPTGDALHNCRQASNSQILTSWVNPEQESQPCHVSSRAVGMITGLSVSGAIRDWVVVHRRRRI